MSTGTEKIGQVNAVAYEPTRWDRFKHWLQLQWWRWTRPFRKSNYEKKAIQEFKIMKKHSPDAIVLRYQKPILALLRELGKEGLSGGSAPFYAGILGQVVEKLALLKNIGPLYGDDSEWNDITRMNDGETMFQNKRNSAVFKGGGDSTPYYLDAIHWKDQNGDITSGNIEFGDLHWISSSQYIRSFPFEPKTFIIDVISTRYADKTERVEDPNGDWWVHKIAHPEQLEQVWKYYAKKISVKG